mmetsp:Transcript_24215/g.77325  ORF Transcript_24215/g.77325 Transcript_24215/m.77325 type:complete len:353 (+) Transcript_24215:456-1514(+)
MHQAGLAAGLVAASIGLSSGCGIEFVLDRRALAEWSYNDTEHWGGDCDLTQQSPIDLPALADLRTDDNKVEDVIQSIQPAYTALTGAELINNGHTVQVNVNNNLTIPSNNLASTVGRATESKSYKLAQFHFHWAEDDTSGSEHTRDGASYPLEVHLVHFNDEYADLSEAADKADGLMVIGYFFEIGEADNDGLAPVVAGLSEVQSKDDTTTIDVDPNDFFGGGALSAYTLYRGSLTTPGCYQSVTWVVADSPLKVTSESLAEFRKVVEGHNNREVQSSVGRSIYNTDGTDAFKLQAEQTGAPSTSPSASPSASPTVETTSSPTTSPTSAAAPTAGVISSALALTLAALATVF